MSPRRTGTLKNLLILVPVLTFLCLSNSSQSQTDDSNSQQKLLFTQWEGNVLSWQRSGSACWVTDSEHNLRLEIMNGGSSQYPNNLTQLLNWNGLEGWTAISTAGGDGTFSRWQEQWQDLSPDMNTWLRLVAHVLVSPEAPGLVPMPPGVRDISPGGRPLSKPRFIISKSDSSSRRLQLPAFSLESVDEKLVSTAFRGMMVNRGHGRGGTQTILNLVGDAASQSGLTITSTHSPGTLVLSQFRALDATYNPEEVFLPWWPLSGYVLLRN